MKRLTVPLMIFLTTALVACDGAGTPAPEYGMNEEVSGETWKISVTSAEDKGTEFEFGGQTFTARETGTVLIFVKIAIERMDGEELGLSWIDQSILLRDQKGDTFPWWQAGLAPAMYFDASQEGPQRVLSITNADAGLDYVFEVPEDFRTLDLLWVDLPTIQVIALDAAAVSTLPAAMDEEIRVRHILLRVTDERTAEEAERQLQEVRARIEAGESFEQLAAEISEDPASRKREGDLGFFGRGKMIREFEEAAFSAAVGDLVGPVRTTFGYHLIRVEEKRERGVE